MKKVTIPVLLALLMLGSPAHARNEVMHLSWSQLIESPDARAKLDPQVHLYLAGQKTPPVLERLDTDTSNKKTRSLGRDTVLGCQRAALSALLSLQASAKKRGANAVVDIISYYDKVPFRSATEYECHDGAMITGVVLQGTYAKVRAGK